MTTGDIIALVLGTLTLLGGFAGWMTWIAVKVGSTYSRIEQINEYIVTHTKQIGDHGIILVNHGERLAKVETLVVKDSESR